MPPQGMPPQPGHDERAGYVLSRVRDSHPVGSSARSTITLFVKTPVLLKLFK